MFNRVKSSASILILATASFAIAGCDDSRVRVGIDVPISGGHGHNHGNIIVTPHGHQASYDAALGMYALLGLANIFWHDGHYYRHSRGGWHRSRDYRRWRRHNGPGRWKNRYPNRVRIHRH